MLKLKSYVIFSFFFVAVFFLLATPISAHAELYYVRCKLKKSVGKCMANEDTTTWSTHASSAGEAVKKGNAKATSSNVNFHKCDKASTVKIAPCNPNK